MSEPVIITRELLASRVVESWLRQYGKDGRGYGSDKAKTLNRLRRLGENPSPDDVDAVIGNKSWTTVPACDGCGAEGESVIIRVGQPQDYESRTADLCLKCIKAVSAVAKKHQS